MNNQTGIATRYGIKGGFTLSINGIDFMHRKNLFHNNYASRTVGQHEATNLITGEKIKINYENGDGGAELRFTAKCLRSVPNIPLKIANIYGQLVEAMQSYLKSEFGSDVREKARNQWNNLEKEFAVETSHWNP